MVFRAGEVVRENRSPGKIVCLARDDSGPGRAAASFLSVDSVLTASLMIYAHVRLCHSLDRLGFLF